MPAKALCLDLDGTLADSLHVMRKVYEQVMAGLNLPSSDQEFQELNGPPLPKIVAILKAKHGLVIEEQVLLKKYLQTVKAAYQTVQPSPGARELLQSAVKDGWCCVVVTSNSEDLAKEWLESTKLAAYFSAIVGLESIKKGKPDPEPYLKALEMVKATPATAFAVEDSATGWQSATAAGLRVYLYCDPKNPFGLNARRIQRLEEMIPILKAWKEP